MCRVCCGIRGDRCHPCPSSVTGHSHCEPYGALCQLGKGISCSQQMQSQVQGIISGKQASLISWAPLGSEYSEQPFLAALMDSNGH